MASDDSLSAPLEDVESNRELAAGWRMLTRAATVVAVVLSPAVFVWLNQEIGWSWWTSLLGTVGLVLAARGFSDLLFHRLLPRPSLFGLETPQLREQDVVARRRRWFWRFWFRMTLWLGSIVLLAWLFFPLGALLGILPLLLIFPFYMIFNFLILFAPLLIMNLMQMKAFEPGDAQWGVKLDDVRGQAEAKEEIRRIVSIWQSGEQFEKSGGKRERGVLFLGAPGTGKTMLAKAIATGFNSPFISMPGSGFAATFIGIDAIVVRILSWRAKRLARKWGGQCIVFIDEIDAVGMRRASLGTGFHQAVGADPLIKVNPQDYMFYGPWGALNPSGDLILETRAWRDRLFEARSSPTIGVTSFQVGVMRLMNFMFPGGMGMGSLALNQLLVVMDGIDNPPFFKKLAVNRLNTFLDAVYVIPRRVKGRSMRLRPARPRQEQIYFIGATNVPISSLDPALTRPGRLGRHVSFRTPTKIDRLDILDLYLGKVAHDSALDTPKRRDEIARITGGYSPAMIEQVCSMALTIAHHSGRKAFIWEDLVESITTLESGMAVGQEYIPEESRAIAVHEAGHAIAGHAYLKDFESTRLSIKQRGDSGGHHQAREKEERFSRFQSEMFAWVVWVLGAMAAERVFYSENSNGVGGDVQMATSQSALMVGAAAMGPQPFSVAPLDGETVDDARRRVLDRFERIGLQIMNRIGGGNMMNSDPIGGVLMDPTKRAIAGQVLGQAYVSAHNLILSNRSAVDRIADDLIVKKEIFGDELMELLESCSITIPEIDLNDETSWPDPMFSPMARPEPAHMTAPGANGHGRH